MPIFNNVQELLNNAINRGIISLTNLCVRVGPVNIVAQNGAINILKPIEWKNFLTFIVKNSDFPAEINQANLYLNLFSSAETAREQQLKQIRPQIINTIDVNLLSNKLSEVTTVEDVISLVDNFSLSKLLPTIIPNGISMNQPPLPASPQQSSTPQSLQPQPPMTSTVATQPLSNIVDLHWKKPIIINKKLRYYTQEIDWFVERQETYGPNCGLTIYYSIFSADNLEKARYDRLKDAKKDMLQMYKKLK